MCTICVYGASSSAIDERYMKRAEELLFGEFAAALGIAPSEVQDYIENRIGGKIEA